jgi:hypothetical protein
MGYEHGHIPYGENQATKGIQVYKVGPVTISRHEPNQHFAFFDTEGFMRPPSRGDAKNNYRSATRKVLAAISSVPCLIVYVAHSWDINDEKHLRVISSLAQPSSRLTVLHNDTHKGIDIEQRIETLLSYRQLPIQRINQSLTMTSNVNGFIVEHYFYCHNKIYGNVVHNENVQRKLISLMHQQPPISVSDVKLAIEDKFFKMIHGFFTHQYRTPWGGAIAVEYRILSNDEKESPGLNETTDSRIKTSPDDFRVIQIRGDLNLNTVKVQRVQVDGEKLDDMEYFQSLTFTNYSGFAEAQPFNIWMWTSDIIVENVGSVLKENSCHVFVKVV